MSNELEVLSKKRADETLSKTIDDAYDAIVASIPRKTMPEAVFKDRFLEPIINIGSADPKYAGIVTEYVSFTGSPSVEVDLTDDNGNVVATVPPLYASINLNASNGTDMSTVLHAYSLKSAHFMPQAEAYLHNALDAVGKEMTVGNAESVKSQWGLLISRYSVNDKVDNTPSVKTTIINNTVEDDLIYD